MHGMATTSTETKRQPARRGRRLVDVTTKTDLVWVRVKPDLKRALVTRAYAADVTLSEFIRRCVEQVVNKAA